MVTYIVIAYLSISLFMALNFADMFRGWYKEFEDQLAGVANWIVAVVYFIGAIIYGLTWPVELFFYVRNKYLDCKERRDTRSDTDHTQ